MEIKSVEDVLIIFLRCDCETNEFETSYYRCFIRDFSYRISIH